MPRSWVLPSSFWPSPSRMTNGSKSESIRSLFPKNSLLAKVDGVYNAILVEGDLVGNVLFYGQGAGPEAYQQCGDRRCGIRSSGYSSWSRQPDQVACQPKIIKPMAEVVTRYYIRMNVADQAGVITQITRSPGR